VGRPKQMVVPWDEDSVQLIKPPWASTMYLEIDRPSPEPGIL